MPWFGGSPTVVPEKLALQLAKAVGEGTFEKVRFRKKPFVDIFPTKKTCPHCGGRRGKAWDFPQAERLLDNMVRLAQQIKQRKLCLSCLGQLSELAKMRQECLGGLDEGNPPKSSSEKGKPGVSTSRNELDEQMQAITHQSLVRGHTDSDHYCRSLISWIRSGARFEVEIADGGKRIRLRPRHLDSLSIVEVYNKRLPEPDYCGRCGEIYEEWEFTPDGRIFLTYCEEEYDDESGVTTGHWRRRREVIWNPQGKAFRFPPSLLDKTLDPVIDLAFKPIEGVLGFIGRVIKAATWFVYCSCSNPDPYLASYSEGTPFYKCRRCGNFVDK